MITPFGRFRWVRLPFGLKVSSEIFQRKLTEALSRLDVFDIADDIIKVGFGDTFEKAKADNERKLQELFTRCKKQNMIELSEISFHEHVISKDGVEICNKTV